jgi:hypothetical protein
MRRSLASQEARELKNVIEINPAQFASAQAGRARRRREDASSYGIDVFAAPVSFLRPALIAGLIRGASGVAVLMRKLLLRVRQHLNSYCEVQACKKRYLRHALLLP